MSENILTYLENELAEAGLMTQEGSYDGEDYWRGWSDALAELKRKIESGEVTLA